MAEHQQEPHLRQTRSRKVFDLAPSAEPSEPPTPIAEDSNPESVENNSKDKDELSSSRTRSILNLTSSTLLGIYQPTALDSSSREDLTVDGTTPWGTGALTPNLHAISEGPEDGGAGTGTAAPRYPKTIADARPHPRRHGFRGLILPLFLRAILLFGFGVAYGTIITHFHDSPRLTPVKIENIDYDSWQYMLFWGAAGVALGSLLPWCDTLWEDFTGSRGDSRKVSGGGAGAGNNGNGFDRSSARATGSLATEWNPVVRGIGAFVGIAFAIRKLPWQSTLQVSLTLALVNPFLWYLIDRSKPGFILSTLVGLTGMLALLSINPEVVPSPAAVPSQQTTTKLENATVPDGSGADMILGFISHEKIAVGTWIASVLFCSCVCFGNIGRRLALGGGRS